MTVVYSTLWGETDADTNLVSGPTALVAAPKLNLLDWKIDVSEHGLLSFRRSQGKLKDEFISVWRLDYSFLE